MSLIQPIGTKLCGHYCIAFLTGIEIGKVIELIGHKKGTKTSEIRKHLKLSGNKKGYPENKSMCISRPKGFRNWHWVVYENGIIYDPLLGSMPIDVWKGITELTITSHFEII